jgi:hypothetical protein
MKIVLSQVMMEDFHFKENIFSNIIVIQTEPYSPAIFIFAFGQFLFLIHRNIRGNTCKKSNNALLMWFVIIYRQTFRKRPTQLLFQNTGA